MKLNNIHLSGRFCIRANLTKELFSVLLIIVKLPILDKRLTAPGKKNSAGREFARHFVQKWQIDYRIPESPAAAHPSFASCARMTGTSPYLAQRVRLFQSVRRPGKRAAGTDHLQPRGNRAF